MRAGGLYRAKRTSDDSALELRGGSTHSTQIPTMAQTGQQLATAVPATHPQHGQQDDHLEQTAQ